MDKNLKSHVIILQARTNSSRLPKKVLADVGANKTLIEFLLSRLIQCSLVDEIVVATTDHESDNKLTSIVRSHGIKVVRGSEENVLNRFCLAAKEIPSKNYIRITGDCPLVDPKLIDRTIDFFENGNFDYVSNSYPPTFPDGMDVEIFNREVLFEADLLSKNKFEREHVTPWIRNNNELKKGCLKNIKDLSESRWTVDEKEDLELIRTIISHFKFKNDFSLDDILLFEKNNPEIFLINKKFLRNEGSIINNGEKLWRRAKKIIPGGSMLLSKRSEIYLPGKWPSYFSKTKGCNVWDLENNKLVDMSLMGVGTNILGYSNEEVDNAVIEIIRKGNLSTLNCPEEVYLAEKLVEIHPWADMVRFARTGGEANAIAVRIARAATNKDKIAICGYHGWHDWYLATNLEDINGLNTHLLPGLNPKGVPSGLKGSVLPFKYNHVEQLKKIVYENNIAAVKMEVERSEPPMEGFLEEIRAICDANNIVLIFDECSSGFRETFGGLHKKYGVNPDIAIFGKTLGNGYAITSIIGKEKVMQHAQDTFISSTFWTERIGSAAALKTLEVMKKVKSWEYVAKMGKYLKQLWINLAKSYDLSISIYGIDPLISFKFNSMYYLEYKTFITQEMLKYGFLATTTCYLSMAHSNSIIDEYAYYLEKVFQTISECENGSKNIKSLLEGEVCHEAFKRLN